MSEIVNPILSYDSYGFNTPKRIAAVRTREPKAEYVADLCLKARDGSWMPYPFGVFYVAETRPGYPNHYFGLYDDTYGVVTIVNADSAAYDTEHKTLWAGLRLPDGTVMFSQWRHDFKDRGGVAVDGGQDYFRVVGRVEGMEKVMLGLVGGKWVVDPHV